MNKTIKLALVSGVLLTGALAAQYSASADQTIMGSKDASVDFVGKIGQFDPETTDPTLPGLPGDDAWIKVKMPTDVAYYSTGSSSHKNIESAKHEITNLSTYGVSVSVTGFTAKDGTSSADVSHQESLNLHAGSVNVPLITGGTATPTLDAKLFTLGSNPGATNPQDTTLTNKGEFNITGTTTGSDLTTTQHTVENKLHFTLKSIDPGDTSLVSISAKPVSLTVGGTWTPESGFDGATDKYGNTVPFASVTVGGDTVDTATAGTYNVIYSYGGKTATSVVTVAP